MSFTYLRQDAPRGSAGSFTIVRVFLYGLHDKKVEMIVDRYYSKVFIIYL
jgi:hypothetical protein